MTSIDQEYRITPLDELVLHPRNPRIGDVATIKESIETNGFYGTVIAQKSTGYVLAGNHRVKAVKELGWSEIPVTWVDVDEETATKILVVDNRANDKAGYDDKALLAILKDLESMDDLTGTGFDEEGLAELERLTGDLAEANSSWLDEMVEGGDSNFGTIAPGKPKLKEGEEGNLPGAKQYFALTYMFEFNERARIVEVLAKAKDVYEVETTAEALVHVMDDWAEVNLDQGAEEAADEAPADVAS